MKAMTTRKVHTFENINEKKIIALYRYLKFKLSFNCQLKAGNLYDKYK